MKSLVSVLLLAACGDDGNSSTVDAPSGDGPVDSGPVFRAATVVAGDFGMGNPGVLATVELGQQGVTTNAAPAGAIDSDPLVRPGENGEVLVINRATNNITILGPSGQDRYALVEQLSTGAGSNPQDVAQIGTKLYVPTLSGAGVVVLTRGSAALATIDLSADDPDDNPDCSSIYAVGTKLFVACGLLDNFAPRGVGRVYVIDSATDTVTGSVMMANENPFGLFERDPALYGGDLLISSVDYADNNAGCVERISTGAAPASNGCVVTNTALGGFANRITFHRGEVVVAVNGNTFPDANLQRISSTGTPAVISPPAQHISDAMGCHDKLVVADQTMGASGVRMYGGADGVTEVTSAPVDVGLPPKSSHGIVCW